MDHVRGAPYHPMAQGKVERWHQTPKNRILLEHHYLPSDLTSADVFFGRGRTIPRTREWIKRQAIAPRRLQHQRQAASISPTDGPGPPLARAYRCLKDCEDAQIKEFPPRQKVASFSLDQVMKTMTAPAGDGSSRPLMAGRLIFRSGTVGPEALTNPPPHS